MSSPPSFPNPARARAPVITVRGLGKQYGHFASPQQRLRALLGWAGQPTGQWSLKGVDFSLQPGQCLGVVGDNGAGKSTLLKLLAGTLVPSTGEVHCDGRITAILELGAGFHPDFTGRENLWFAGRLTGLSAADIEELAPDVLAFAGLGEAIDRPVKTYSSGMLVRLAFALVTARQPEVLIIDEALAVGDQVFQKKCIERIAAFRQAGCTILFCSHSLYHVRQLCDQVLWLHQGQVQKWGDTEEVLAAYDSHVRQHLAVGSQAVTDVKGTDVASQVPGVGTRGDARLLRLPDKPGRVTAPQAPTAGRAALMWMEMDAVEDEQGALRLPGTDLVIRLAATMPGDECPSLAVMLEQAHGVGITTTGTHADGVRPWRTPQGHWTAEVRFPALPLHSGEYVLSAYLFDERGLVVYEEWKHCLHFVHVYPDSTPGLLRLPHEWSSGAGHG